MGLNFFGSDRRETIPESPNPNPSLFSIIKREIIGDYSIVEVLYYGCTTFEGRKLMLLKTRTVPLPLDPHLLGNDHPVIARFEPNKDGWRLARLCALNLTEMK